MKDRENEQEKQEKELPAPADWEELLLSDEYGEDADETAWFSALIASDDILPLPAGSEKEPQTGEAPEDAQAGETPPEASDGEKLDGPLSVDEDSADRFSIDYAAQPPTVHEMRQSFRRQFAREAPDAKKTAAPKRQTARPMRGMPRASGGPQSRPKGRSPLQPPQKKPPLFEALAPAAMQMPMWKSIPFAEPENLMAGDGADRRRMDAPTAERPAPPQPAGWAPLMPDESRADGGRTRPENGAQREFAAPTPGAPPDRPTARREKKPDAAARQAPRKADRAAEFSVRKPDVPPDRPTARREKKTDAAAARQAPRKADRAAEFSVRKPDAPPDRPTVRLEKKTDAAALPRKTDRTDFSVRKPDAPTDRPAPERSKRADALRFEPPVKKREETAQRKQNASAAPPRKKEASDFGRMKRTAEKQPAFPPRPQRADKSAFDERDRRASAAPPKERNAFSRLSVSSEPAGREKTSLMTLERKAARKKEML